MKRLKEIRNEIWTLLGMFIAWVVLDPSTKTVVGGAILVTFFVWLVTIDKEGGEE